MNDKRGTGQPFSLQEVPAHASTLLRARSSLSASLRFQKT